MTAKVDSKKLEAPSKKTAELKTIIDFLEYEEALTKDPATATRIKKLLIKLKIWN